MKHFCFDYLLDLLVGMYVMVVGGYATRATGEPSVIKVSVFTCLSIVIELVLK